MAPVLAALLALFALPGAAAEPIVGFNFPAWWKDSYVSPRARLSLERLAGTGAGWIAVTPTVYARHRRDSDIAVTDSTADEASLRTVIRDARARGLKVMMKPHVDIPGGVPRAALSPGDPERWFSHYRRHLLFYARLAREEGCEMLAVGTELSLLTLPQHTRRWRELIAAARAEYPGPLVYAANWHSVAHVGFWDEVDYIGVDGYYPVPGGHDRRALRENWRPWVAALAALSKAWGKPVLFTEVGLSSQEGANLRPWAYHRFGALDQEVQAAYMDSFLRAFEPQPWFAGYLYWAWELDPDAGGPADTSMTVQGKPALDVLRRSFSQARTPAPAPERPDLREAARRTWGAMLRGLPGF